MPLTNGVFGAWSEHVTNYEVRRRTGQPLLSDTVRTRRLKLFGHARGTGRQVPRSFPCSTSPLQGTGDGVQVVQDIPDWGRWRKLRQFNLGLASGLRRAQNSLNRTAWRTLIGTAATSPTSSDWTTVIYCSIYNLQYIAVYFRNSLSCDFVLADTFRMTQALYLLFITCQCQQSASHLTFW